MPDIVIASGKGGTGKTTVSTNLAALLAETDPVVLVDLDVEEPNSGLFIKLGKEIMVFPELCHACFACSELCPVDALPMKPVRMGATTRSELGNLTFIESRLDVGQEQVVPLISQTKANVAHDLRGIRYRLYDAPPGTSCPVIKASKDADDAYKKRHPRRVCLNRGLSRYAANPALQPGNTGVCLHDGHCTVNGGLLSKPQTSRGARAFHVHRARLGHCTGPRAYASLYTRLPGRVTWLACGLKATV